MDFYTLPHVLSALTLALTVLFLFYDSCKKLQQKTATVPKAPVKKVSSFQKLIQDELVDKENYTNCLNLFYNSLSPVLKENSLEKKVFDQMYSYLDSKIDKYFK